MTLSITRESPDQAAVLDLLRQADARVAGLYPAEDRRGLDIAALLAPNIRFFVVRRGDAVLGCGGYAVDGAGAAELKRIFVVPAARGLGVGWALLDTLETEAGREGVRLMRLETGVKSAEAIGLYRRFGYRETGPFGAYGPDPSSVFMGKALPGAG